MENWILVKILKIMELFNRIQGTEVRFEKNAGF